MAGEKNKGSTDQTRSGESNGDLDEDLEGTFPASDPVGPQVGEGATSRKRPPPPPGEDTGPGEQSGGKGG